MLWWGTGAEKPSLHKTLPSCLKFGHPGTHALLTKTCESLGFDLLIFHILGMFEASVFTFNSLHVQVEKDGFTTMVEFL